MSKFAREVKNLKKQYIVHTSGEVLNKKAKAYVIKASSREKAQEIARNHFSEDFYAADETIYAKPYSRTWKAVLAFLFMLVPILLSFVDWKVGHDTVSIRPDYISCLYAVLLYAAFVVRFKGIQRAVASWIDIIFCFLIVLLLSSFIQTILVTKTFSLFGLTEISIDTNILLPIAILLSWLGLKFVSAACMIGIGILAIFHISSLSSAMGSLYGPAYILCAFMGILLYLSIEPALVEALPHFRKSVSRGFQYMQNDFAEVRGSARNLDYMPMRHTSEKMLDSEAPYRYRSDDSYEYEMPSQEEYREQSPYPYEAQSQYEKDRMR